MSLISHCLIMSPDPSSVDQNITALAGPRLNLRPTAGPSVRPFAPFLHYSLALPANSIQLTKPLPLLPTPHCLLWLQSWTQFSKDREIIRRENCSWHYFWKAGYSNESRAGILCVWGHNWKPSSSPSGGGGCLVAAWRERAQLCSLPQCTWEQNVERTSQGCLQQWQEPRVRLSN